MSTSGRILLSRRGSKVACVRGIENCESNLELQSPRERVGRGQTQLRTRLVTQPVPPSVDRCLERIGHIYIVRMLESRKSG